MRPLIVIPTYNERENICQIVPAVLALDPEICVLVVDDSSPDGTARAVEEMHSQSLEGRLFLETRPRKLGLAKAYIHGFEFAIRNGFDFVVQMDADGSHSPRDLATMLSLTDQADFLIGSRYVNGGGTRNWGPGRRLLSRFGGYYARSILGVAITDFTGGFNGWNIQVLRASDLSSLASEGYTFQIELKYRASRLGFQGLEFPIIFEERRAGQSIPAAECWRRSVRSPKSRSTKRWEPMSRAWSSRCRRRCRC